MWHPLVYYLDAGSGRVWVGYMGFQRNRLTNIDPINPSSSCFTFSPTPKRERASFYCRRLTSSLIVVT
uniref:Uncharacterized protein n=1 Tax=Helianthus annuus TaxID=4232 RepID=A0A251VNQ7_HELAN